MVSKSGGVILSKNKLKNMAYLIEQIRIEKETIVLIAQVYHLSQI